MILSDVSVRRPVLAAVISLLLIAFGVVSFRQLPLRELPDIDPPIVSIETRYRGASAPVVESRVTQPIEDSVSGVEGIETIDAVSRDGRSSVSIEFDIDRDVDAAANDLRDAVSRVMADLPREADPPEIFKANSDESPIVWFNLNSTTMTPLELSDYAERYLVDRLSTIDGVARVRLSGSRRPAMRIWLDRVALAARGLTVADVESTLRAENVELPAGRLESVERDFTVRLARGYTSAEDFARLALARGDDGHLVRLGEVARVELGAEDYRSEFRGNGEPQLSLGIVKQSTANTLAVARAARRQVEDVIPTLPEGTSLNFSFDRSAFIDAAIDEVYRTLAIALVLVVSVIFLFLGSVRAALIPALALPVALTASFVVLAALGLSVNLLTLLALVLAIGLVVDDAIVVLENIQRRVDLGEPALVAAFRGAGEVGFAVVSTTVVLIAVFVPIAFLEGNVGRLFTELAITIAAAVAFSSIVALSLSPMLCSKLLRPTRDAGGLSRAIRSGLENLGDVYARALESVLRRPRLVLFAYLGVFAAAAVLFREVPGELAPREDRGVFSVLARGPEGASFDSSIRNMEQVEGFILPLLDTGDAIRVLVRVPGSWNDPEAMNTGRVIVVLDHWDHRERAAPEIMAELSGKLRTIPGVRAVPLMRAGLGQRGASQPVQFVIGGSTYDEIAAWQETLLTRAAENPRLLDLDGSYRQTKPQLHVEVDRTRAADLGIPLETVGRTLETMLGSRRVTTFVDRGEEYDVILQGLDEQRRAPTDVSNLYVRSERSGELVPLANLVRFREVADAGALTRFNRLRAATITSNLAPGYSLSEALAYLEDLAGESLPRSARVDYRGESREFKESSAAVYFTFGLALLVVFLVLAAQFESFVHPFIILLTVPLAVAGALFGLWLSGGTLNIYSQIGVVILIGLAAKNGILIVEFANQLRDQGRDFDEAIREASRIRFRPILMTGLSTAIGALPLVLASGAGSASRVTIGTVIFAGVLVATLLTLFVVPVFYGLLARRTRSPEALTRELERLENAA